MDKGDDLGSSIGRRYQKEYCAFTLCSVFKQGFCRRA